MASFALVPVEKMPLHVLFPEQYAAAKRTVARDFLFFGVAIAGSVILAATIHLALA